MIRRKIANIIIKNALYQEHLLAKMLESIFGASRAPCLKTDDDRKQMTFLEVNWPKSLFQKRIVISCVCTTKKLISFLRLKKRSTFYA